MDLKLRVSLVFVIICMLHFSTIIAQQDLLSKKIVLPKKEYSIPSILKILQTEKKINFSINNEVLKTKSKIFLPETEYKLETILNEMSRQANIDFFFQGDILVLKIKLIKMKYSISGYVKNISNGEVLVGANVYDENSFNSTTTNSYGFFSLTIPEGNIELTCSYIGYINKTIILNLTKDTSVIIELKELPINIDEVTIKSSKLDNVHKLTRMSSISIPVESMNTLPTLLGESDIMKIAQLMPGIQSGIEGTGNIYVRGGGPGQNLILLDGVQIYNPSHMLGLVSFFNSSSINSMEIIKGGYPARYGGRLSSVIDITMKEGNNRKFQGEATIGLLLSKLTLEGPINKGKTSYLITGRRTYFDVLARPFLKASYGDDKYGYYIYDINMKINHSFSNKDKIFYSFYIGDERAYGDVKSSTTLNSIDVDRYNYYGVRWSNIMSAIRWNHIYNGKLFSNVTLSFSRYIFNVLKENKVTSDDSTIISSYEEVEHTSEVGNWGINVGFYYIPNPNHTIRFGMEGKIQSFSPAKYHLFNEVEDSTFGTNTTTTNDLAMYVEDDFNASKKIKINIGLRYSNLLVKNDFYYSVEPRITFRYLINNNFSCKLSYARMSQYLHLLTHFGYGAPTEIWIPTTEKVKPLISHQIAAGVAYLINKRFEISMESYYKEMQNVIEFKEGADLFALDKDWQDKIVTGSGRSYGFEFLLHKKQGNLSGWVGYTLSWTDRQFDDLFYGKRFPYIYDRRHDIGCALLKKLKKMNKISLTWVYGTGNSITIPIETYDSRYWGEQGEVVINGNRNSYRMRAYHRLDASIIFNKQKKHGLRTWTFSLYNVYSRRNPFVLDFSIQKRKFIEYSLLPIIPSVSYKFKF